MIETTGMDAHAAAYLLEEETQRLWRHIEELREERVANQEFLELERTMYIESLQEVQDQLAEMSAASKKADSRDDETIQDLEEKMKQAEMELTRIGAEKDALSEEYNELNAQMERKDEQVRSLEAELSKVDEKVLGLKSQLVQSQQKLDDMQKAREASEQQFGDGIAEHTASLKRERDRYEEMVNAYEQLKQELAQTQSRLAEKIEELDKIRGELETSQIHLRRKEQDCADLEDYKVQADEKLRLQRKFFVTKGSDKSYQNVTARSTLGDVTNQKKL